MYWHRELVRIENSGNQHKKKERKKKKKEIFAGNLHQVLLWAHQVVRQYLHADQKKWKEEKEVDDVDGKKKLENDVEKNELTGKYESNGCSAYAAHCS